MQKLMLVAVISLIVSACSHTPVKPVPLPLVPAPLVEELTETEIRQLSQCTEDKTFCAIHRSALLKAWDALFAYRAAYIEADAILRSTHE